MKKQLTKISTLILALFSFSAFSQQKIQPCNTFAAMEQAFSQNPELKKKYEDAQAQFKQELEANSAARTATAPMVYTVPVVFHVIYDCNGTNIADTTIIQALANINKDYARIAGDTALVATPFKNSYINSNIQMVLAKKDPQGNCTNGIVRHLDPVRTHWSQTIANNTSNMAVSNAYYAYTWDPTKYMNVYLVSDIVPQGTVTGGGIIVGYTFRPGPFASNPHDVIIYNMSFVGGSSNGIAKSRSLSHEMGHWFNLAHTWGSSNNPGVNCNDDDGLADTPVTKGEFGGCASSTIAVCTQTNPAMAGLNNVQNIMNYSDCPRNFTTDQTNAMRTALASSINSRNNLYTSTNLAFTGVNNTTPCAPIADFLPTNCTYSVCAGGSISMKDMSYNYAGTLTSLAWAGDNGAVIASPNASVTSITFPTIGTTNVSLTATNAQGSTTKVKTFTVMDPTPGFGPVTMESFEAPGVPPNWVVVNPDNDATMWAQTSQAAYDGSNSFMVDASSDPANSSDILQMPIMDVLNHPSNVFEFAYAYRQQTATQNDVLKVEGSKDCGGTWQTIYSMTGNIMQQNSGGIGTDYYIPGSNEWKVYTLSSHPQWQNYKSSASVMVRFNFIEGSTPNGNNVYLDAVNWYSPTGINELSNSIRFALYPNPTSSSANVNFSLNDPAMIKISVMDIMGREVLPVVESKYNAGEQNVVINKDNTLSKGVYFVNLTVNGARISSKLVIN